MENNDRKHTYENILAWWYAKSIYRTHKHVEQGDLNDKNYDLFIDKYGHKWDFIITGPCSAPELQFCIREWNY
jgi:hypothetical protein